MKFIDEATIYVKAGNGGAGLSHFRREKYVPLGGPDGGDGGKGGDVVLVADRNKHTLLDFKFVSSWQAKNGEAGGVNKRTGKNGEDLVIKVPIGTQIIDADKDLLIADLDEDEKEFIVAKGGRGGKGNAFFKSSTNRAPEKFQTGEEGEEKNISFSLKLVADIGLIGFPNAGKSTFISRVTASRPKIADYPFTTLIPNLGVVKIDDEASFVIADIPGLIEGASDGKGLGTTFLKHIERCKMLAHLIDVSVNDSLEKVLDSYEKINNELCKFSDELANKKQVIFLSKIDSVEDENFILEIQKYFRDSGKDVFLISSVTGKGVKEALYYLKDIVFGE